MRSRRFQRYLSASLSGFRLEDVSSERSVRKVTGECPRAEEEFLAVSCLLISIIWLHLGESNLLPSFALTRGLWKSSQVLPDFIHLCRLYPGTNSNSRRECRWTMNEIPCWDLKCGPRINQLFLEEIGLRRYIDWKTAWVPQWERNNEIFLPHGNW